MSIDAGTTLNGRWTCDRLFATGGMGDVYRAHDTDTGAEAAVKVLRIGVSDGVRRFVAEAEALGQLQHPNIVRLLATGDHDGLPYLVMEFVEGPSLAQMIADQPLSLEDVRLLGQQIASALAYAHDKGVIHRDVKPDNILFDAAGLAHLADFGIARIVDMAGITATGTTVGTASYIAPEQLTDSRAVGPSSDVYSLGLVLLEAATGTRAFTGAPTEAALARLSREPEMPAELPAPWRRLLQSMTAREPAARPEAHTVADLLAAGLPLDRTETLVLPQATAVGTTSSTPGDTAAQATAELGHETEPMLLPDGPAPDPGQEAKDRRGGRLLRWASIMAATVIIIGLAIAVLIPDTTAEPDEMPQQAPATGLPPALDDAFWRLRELVQP